MENVKQEFTTRVEEINRYFIFLEQINDEKVKILVEDTSRNIENQLPPTLRASAILLLYNLLEATAILAIDEIHIHISNKTSLLYKDANDAFKKIWIEYKYNNFNDIGSTQILENLQTIENEQIMIFIPNVDNSKYLEKIKGVTFSGKIDAQQVRSFATKYGFAENINNKGNHLLNIKKLRNALAHGEISFTKCGQDYGYQTLTEMKDNAISFLQEFLDNIEFYLTEEKYRKQ